LSRKTRFLPLFRASCTVFKFLCGRRSFYFLAIVSVLFSLSGCAGGDIANRGSQGTAIICFGDSITAGLEVASQDTYPAQLSRLLGKEVINAGVSGDTTRQALRRIERDVLSRNPKLVLVEFGANDAFQKIDPQETFGNIRKVIDQIHGRGAMAALVTVKVGLINDSYQKEFKKIAREKRAIFIPDIMKGIFTNPAFKTDQLHPNKDGYTIIAQKIYKKIKPFLK